MKEQAAIGQPAAGPSFFGHPPGLATLFFTEMWERFSYYGMRALLILFMTAATSRVIEGPDGVIENPGLGFDVATAAAVYGLYTSLVYIMALPGGWLADNVWGQRKAVWVGGWIIAAGHFTMAVPYTSTFIVGLVLIICGTGLLKPNVSTIVGELYRDAGACRDAGFTIFYMGINIGGFLGPLVTGYLAEGWSWHLGFAAAGVGMVAGLIQYKATERHLGEAGLLKTGESPDDVAAKERKFFAGLGGLVLAVVALGLLVSAGVIPVTIAGIAQYLGYGVLVLVGLYFLYLLALGGHTPAENKQISVIFWLFLLSAIFWSGFEQAGSSLNIFARDLIDRDFGGWELPASWLQSVNALFIILLAPVFGCIWIALERRDADPSIPAKAAMGLLGLALGFFVIAWGAANASPDSPVSPSWLVVMYFMHTVGELCISPIGLSAITKLSPARRVGQMMGVWFVAAALGNLFAGLIAGSLESLDHATLFRTVALLVGVSGVVGLVAAPGIKKLMAGR